MTDASPDKGKGKATDESDAAPALEAPGADAAAPRAEVGIAAEATDKESSAAESSAKDTKESVTDDEEHDGDGDGEGDGEEDDDEEDESDEDEPRLKYTRLTPHLAAVYRNGDMTSSFMVAGDKMFVGTDGGNMHVFQLPTFHSLLTYHAHSASVTAISISPFPPPLPTPSKPETSSWLLGTGTSTPLKSPTFSEMPSAAAAARRVTSQQLHSSPLRHATGKPSQPHVPNVPSNQIYIATASLDGHVCVQSLVDLRDVSLRNFARPVKAVALSPEFRSDRTYLSGGLAGQLVLTVGAGHGLTTSSTTGGVAAVAQAASGWLGAVGLGSSGSGKDTVLHQGEGTISCIRWSGSGRFVAWLNETGIKIMRTNLKLDSASAESQDDAWKRIGHIDRPQTQEWDEMAGLWQGRAEWIDESALDVDEADAKDGAAKPADTTPSPAKEMLKEQVAKDKKRMERLLVGWGGMIWIIHVHAGSIGTGKNVGEKTAGRAEIVKITAEDEDEDEDEDEGAGATTPKLARGHRQRPSTASAGSEPSGGIRRRQNRLPPELRLIDLSSQAEVEKDALGVSRFERLGSNDYHLGVLPAHNAASAAAVSKGALEALAGFGSEVWNATLGGINAVTVNPTKSLFSSGASVLSRHSDDAASGSVRTPTMSTATGASGRLGKGTDVTSMAIRAATRSVHPNLTKPGAKIFVHSPYDCILAVRRDRTDHLAWLLEHHKYEAAWHLVDEHSDVVGASTRRVLDAIPQPATPVRETREFSVPGIAALSPATPALSTREQQDDGFYSDAASVSSTTTGHQGPSSTQAAESEKRRIGELWVAQLVASGDWPAAGETLARVLGNAHADGWRRWAWAFASAGRFDELAAHLPTVRLHPVPIPTTLYEVVLGHYMQAGNRPRLRYLVQERWPPESGLYDVDTVSSALENQLKFRDVREDSVEDGERGRDWRIVLECLARLHEAAGRRRDALRCHIRLQDADAAMRLVRDHHLADAVVDDVPGFVSLRVPRDRADDMSVPELEEATAEAIAVLVESAQLGLVQPRHVIEQLQRKGFMLYVFFYLRALWTGDTGAAAGAAGTDDDGHGHARTQETRDRLALESKDLVGATDYADLAVRLFAEYDRSLLMDFLRRSTAYSFEKAAQECEAHGYVPELVYLYSKTGQAKKALYLIIDRLGDVSQAIAFAKEQDDAYLWDDLLAYSMDKPRFIRALLEEVGTAIDPITLVRRIPEGLEIDGLRQGLRHMMKEHEIQLSISQGVARALRSEVAAAQATLRAGRSKGIKFEVVHEDDKQRQQHEVSVQASDVPTNVAAAATPVVGVSDSLGGQLDGTGDAKGKGKAIAAAPDEDDNDGEILPLEGLLSGTPSKNKGKTKKASSAKGEQPGHSHRLPMPGHCAVCHRAFAAVQDDDDYTSSRADTLVGFACGHVFHLRHLLRMLDALEKGEAEVSDDEDDGDRTPGVGGAYEGTVGHYEGTSNWRRVGSKVTHARLLRDRVAAGCPVCRKLKGETAAVNP